MALCVYILTLFLFVGILILMCACCCFCIRRKWKQFRNSDKGKAAVKGMAGNKLFGKFMTDKVQPDSDDKGLMADVGETAVEEEEEEEPKEVEKIGRLNYKLEYDFNSTNVSAQESINMDEFKRRENRQRRSCLLNTNSIYVGNLYSSSSVCVLSYNNILRQLKDNILFALVLPHCS